jgi:hypothetical protein
MTIPRIYDNSIIVIIVYYSYYYTYISYIIYIIYTQFKPVCQDVGYYEALYVFCCSLPVSHVAVMPYGDALRW